MAAAARGGGVVAIEDLDLEPLDVVVPATEGAAVLSIERVKNAALVATVVKGTNTMWANVWGCSPVTAALTMRLLPLARPVGEKRRVECIELACGCAIPSLAAARGGGRVLATDVTSMALRLLEHNAARNGIPTSAAADAARAGTPTTAATPAGTSAARGADTAAASAAAAEGVTGVLETAFVNVSDEPEALMASLEPHGWSGADVVVASEVMFLSSMQRPVARTAAALLRPGGLGLVVDAMRPSCEGFEGKCEDCGLGSAMIESGPVACNGIELPGCRVFVLFPLARAGESPALEAAEGARLDLTRVCLTGCAPAAVPANAAAAVGEVISLLNTLQKDAEAAAAADSGARKGYCV